MSCEEKEKRLVTRTTKKHRLTFLHREHQSCVGRGLVMVMVPCCVVVEVTHTVVVESGALTKLAVLQYRTLCLPRRCMMQVLSNEHCRCELASGSHCCCRLSSRAYALRLNFCLQKENRRNIDAFNTVRVDASCSRDDEHSRPRYCCRDLNGVLGCAC